MVYDSMTMRIEHEKALKNKHNIYCHKCGKFIIGTMTDAGVMGYNLICPIHGKI